MLLVHLNIGFVIAVFYCRNSSEKTIVANGGPTCELTFTLPWMWIIIDTWSLQRKPHPQLHSVFSFMAASEGMVTE